jgi:hypothetical protein
MAIYVQRGREAGLPQLRTPYARSLAAVLPQLAADDRVRATAASLSPAPCRTVEDRWSASRPLPVVVAVRNLLTLFEHVIFGLVIGDRGRLRRLFTILGIVVGVLILRVAAGAGCHGCESCAPVSWRNAGGHRGR